MFLAAPPTRRSTGRSADKAGSAPVTSTLGRQVTLDARISEVIDGDVLSMEPVRVGRVPAALGTPACYVTVVENDRPILRVDV